MRSIDLNNSTRPVYRALFEAVATDALSREQCQFQEAAATVNPTLDSAEAQAAVAAHPASSDQHGVRLQPGR